ncbi:MAG: hypothetical protein M3332_08170 [Actinomycetota bacterium]|nr:hypothetical protein [Actinomycetota bacterium]
MTGPSPQWALSPLDYRAHVVSDLPDSLSQAMVARCGHHLPVCAGLDAVPRVRV